MLENHLKHNCFGLIVTAILLCAPSLHAQDNKASAVKGSDILPYLEHVIAWHHLISDMEQTSEAAREVLQKDKLRQNAKSILQKSFTFAHAEADIVEASSPAADTPAKNTDSRQGRVIKAIAEANKNAANLQAQLNKEGLAQDERTKLSGRLKLVKAQQELLHTLSGIFNGEGDNSGTLSEQINAIYRTTLSGLQDQPAPAKDDATVKPSAAKDTSQDANTGMFNLSATLFTLSRKKQTIEKLSRETLALTAENRALIDATRNALRDALAQGNALGSSKDTAQNEDAEQDTLDDLILHYKQLGAAIIPLGEISVLLENAQQNLQEWNRLVSANWDSVFHQLVLRLIILTISIVIPLVISGLVHRATDRYVMDPKRRLQLRTVRRILLGGVLTFVVLANFLTEFGSLATFAGFITAGLAVALQTVLISLVAHFLYFGRYGIRAGDRVTISDVTGEVLQVGMMRLYIRQLKETEKGWVPTDKIVAFPNSILFQPSAFYKHIPDGTR